MLSLALYRCGNRELAPFPDIVIRIVAVIHENIGKGLDSAVGKDLSLNAVA